MGRETQPIRIGTKFFKFNPNQDHPEIIRIRSVDEIKNNVKYFDVEGNKKSMSLSDLKNDFRMLKPDGVANFIIVDAGEVSDVLVTIVSYDNASSNLPFAVCRQCIYDIFTNLTERIGRTVLGISISQNTCPANVNFADVFICKSVKESVAINVYLDDDLEDILSLVNTKKYDAVLRNSAGYIRLHYPTMPSTNESGICETLKQLLEINNFMYDFRQCFGIVEIPFKVDEKSEELSIDNILYLEDLIKKNIMETYVIQYTKEIDLRTIKRDYMLVTSSMENHQNVYIVGYDVSDNEYVDRSKHSDML